MLLCAVSSIYSQPTKQPQSGQAKASSAAQSQDNPQPPIQITVTTPEKTPDERKADEERAQRQDATNNRIAQATDRIAALTFWLVIVGGLQVLATVAGFAVSMKAAKAAQSSAATAEAALKITQRAVVGLGNWTIDGLHDGSQPRNFSFVMSNNGPTKAITHTRYVRQVVAPALPDTPAYLPAKTRVAVPIPPSHRQRQYLDIAPLSAEELQDVVNGSKALWLYGYVEYEDVFGMAHRTGYCVSWNKATNTLRINGPNGYNYSD